MLHDVTRFRLVKHNIFLAHSDSEYANETNFTCELFENFAAESLFAGYLIGF